MRVSFRVSMVTTIMVLVVCFSVSVLVSLWFVSSNAAQENAQQLFRAISTTLNERVEGLIDQTVGAAEIGSELSQYTGLTEFNQHPEKIRPMITMLRSQPELYSVYFGYRDSSFLQVIAVRENHTILKMHGAPDKTSWIVRRIFVNDVAIRVQDWTFLDFHGNVLSQKRDLNPAYDPTVRPWYKGAIIDDGPYVSEVYIFNSSGEPGLTAARRLTNKQGVFGADLTLEFLNAFINKQSVSENGSVAVFNADQKTIAVSDNLGPIDPLSNLGDIENDLFQSAIQTRGDHLGFHVIEAETQKIFSNNAKIDFFGNVLSILVIAPQDDFQTVFRKMQNQVIVYGGVALVIFIPLSYLFSARLTRRVIDLANDARKIMQFEFTHVHKKPSKIKEFYTLETSFYEMNDTLDEKTRALNISQAKLSRLVEMGISLSAERDIDKLMEMMLSGAKDIANADGAILYKIEEGFLDFKIFKNDKLEVSLKEKDQKVTIKPMPLFDEEGQPLQDSIATACVHQARSINIEDAYGELDFDISRTLQFDRDNNYRSCSLLTVPLKPMGGDVIGVLQLVNARDPETHQTLPFGDEVQRFCEALSAQAATIMHNVDLFDAQEQLMDAMIQIMAGAIDAKSPYTGGHCLRVPQLALMLAQKASDATQGTLADFRFKSEEEWREFSIGAWLHDCGKVVTPEYVVDKATKLETIYNRIHEIRTRFEVLLRDAEIDFLKKSQNNPDQRGSLETEFSEKKAELLDDFAFVAKTNIGGEYMVEADQERLANIAKRTWVRNLDIRLGLSHQEEEIYASCPQAPHVENLLSDQPYHVIARERDVLEQYGALGFKVDIPENQYNRGELYNLSVGRGTLSEEERFKINEHIMQTILMLETLPFPAHLKRVPEYAGTHHETMIGTGYPRKLSADDLSIPARIMAIADIFEALTASDRPYKKAKTLSEAVQILYTFKKDQHIDPVLFDLFLTSGVYLEYANRYLLPEQIDKVEIAQYLSRANETEPLTA